METNKFQELTGEELVTIDGGIWVGPVPLIVIIMLEIVKEIIEG